jgi:hypothetical protein
MKKEEIKKIRSWGDVSLMQYMQIMDIISANVKDDEIYFEIVKVLYGEEIEDLSISEYSNYLSTLVFLHTDIPRVEPKKEYILGGRKYKTVLKLKELTGNQYVDYTTYIRQNKGVENFSKLVSVFLIPEKSKYGDDSYDLDELQNLIEEEMSIVDVQSISFFLERLLKIYMISLAKSSYQTMKNMMKKEKDCQKKKLIAEKMNEILNKMEEMITTLYY